MFFPFIAFFISERKLRSIGGSGDEFDVNDRTHRVRRRGLNLILVIVKLLRLFKFVKKCSLRRLLLRMKANKRSILITHLQTYFLIGAEQPQSRFLFLTNDLVRAPSLKLRFLPCDNVYGEKGLSMSIQNIM